jgi:hypothetical protein
MDPLQIVLSSQADIARGASPGASRFQLPSGSDQAKTEPTKGPHEERADGQHDGNRGASHPMGLGPNSGELNCRALFPAADLRV